VISSVARNLVLQHMIDPFLRHGISCEQSNIGIEDEISRYARNDKGGAWVLSKQLSNAGG
ncbi:MAG TPA: hypothetical protein VF914_18340, partial [Chloroflexia bacterium]